MGAAALVCFIRIERGVYTAENDDASSGSHLGADLITAKRVTRVDPDADDIAVGNRREIDTFERLVDNVRIAETAAARSGENIQPTRRDDGHAE